MNRDKHLRFLVSGQRVGLEPADHDVESQAHYIYLIETSTESGAR